MFTAAEKAVDVKPTRPLLACWFAAGNWATRPTRTSDGRVWTTACWRDRGLRCDLRYLCRKGSRARPLQYPPRRQTRVPLPQGPPAWAARRLWTGLDTAGAAATASGRSPSRRMPKRPWPLSPLTVRYTSILVICAVHPPRFRKQGGSVHKRCSTSERCSTRSLQAVQYTSMPLKSRSGSTSCTWVHAIHVVSHALMLRYTSPPMNLKCAHPISVILQCEFGRNKAFYRRNQASYL